jgi:hypothetical protein
MRVSRGWRRLPLVQIAVAAAVLTAGCGGGGSSADKPKDAPLATPSIVLPATEPDDLSGVHLPLDAYGVTADQASVIFQAKQKALRDCMAAKGFEYEEEQQRPTATTAWLDPDNLGLVSAKAAAKTGYHRPPRDSGAGGPGDLGGKSEEYNKALSGAAKPGAGDAEPADRGCQGAADQRLTPTDGASSKLPLVDQLRGRAFTAAVSDARVTAAKSAWTECMAKKGYKYANPAAPLAAAWPDPVSTAELETAVADMACKKDARVLGTWSAVIAGYQSALIAQNEAALQGVKESVTARVERAKAVLGGAQ